MNEVQSEFLRYYGDLLGSSQHVLPIEPGVIENGPILSAEQGPMLCRPVTDQEVKEAIFSIPTMKSPGLDGFSSGFSKLPGTSLEMTFVLQSKIFSSLERC